MKSASSNDSIDPTEMIAKINAILLETPNGEFKDPTPYSSPRKGYIDVIRETSASRGSSTRYFMS